MKKVLLSVLFTSVSIFASAQNLPVDPETKKITYTEVVETPGIKQNDLYSRAQTWFAKTYGSSKSVLEIQDKENGKLMGKGITEVSFKNPPMGTRYGGIVRYTISVLVKDGKYKYSISDLFHEGGTDTQITACGALENEKKPKGGTMRGLSGQGGFPTQKQWEQIKEDVNTQMTALTASLKSGIAKSEADF